MALDDAIAAATSWISGERDTRSLFFFAADFFSFFFFFFIAFPSHLDAPLLLLRSENFEVDDFSRFKVVQFGTCSEVPKLGTGNTPPAPSPSPAAAAAKAPSPLPPTDASGRRKRRSLLADAPKKPAASSSAAPIPPSSTPEDACKALITSFSISPISVPAAKEFEQLPEAVSGGAVAAQLRSRGFNVQTVHIRELKVDNALLESAGANETLPAGATGSSVVQFTLRLMGPDALLGNGGLLRVLMRDGIATQLASGTAATTGKGGGPAVPDAVSVANSRLVDVKLVRAPGGAGDPAPRRRRSSRRSLLLLEGAPPAGSPERAAAVAKASAETAKDAATIKAAAASAEAAAAAASGDPARATPQSSSLATGSTTSPTAYRFDHAAATSPAIDVTAAITHLSSEGVRRVYADINTLSETNQFTNLLKAAGYRIDSARDAPITSWFTVDGVPYGSRSSLVERAQAGDARPLARAIVIPLFVLGLFAVIACCLCSLRRRQMKKDRETGIYYRNAGCWPRFLGGSSLPRSTGLDAAVAAAVRKAGGPVSAAELLLRDIESGGKAAASAPGISGGGKSGSGGLLHGAFAAVGAGGAGSGTSGDGGGAAGGGARSGSGALPPRASPSMDGTTPAASASAAGAFLDDDPYGRLARGWQLDPASLQILTKPDGSEWELGCGTSGRVYKALYNGVQEVAVKVFNEALPSLQALAEEEERVEEEEVGGKAGAAAGGGGGLGGKRRSSTNHGGTPKKSAAGLKTAFRAAMAFRRSGTGASGKRSACGEAAAEDDSEAAVAVVSPPSSLATEAPATNSSSSTMATATKANAAATDVTSAPAGGLVTAQSKGAGLSSADSTLTKKPPPPSRQRAAAKQQLEDLAREVLLLRACHDRNVVSFVGASVQSGHAVLVTVRCVLRV